MCNSIRISSGIFIRIDTSAEAASEGDSGMVAKSVGLGGAGCVFICGAVCSVLMWFNDCG